MTRDETRDSLAKESLILDMLERFSPGQTRDIRPMLAVLCRSVEDLPLEAVAMGCDRFKSGVLPRNHAFAPNAVELVAEVTKWLPPEPRIPLFNGLLSTNWGMGDVDLRGLTREQQERVESLPKTATGMREMRQLANDLRASNSEKLGIPFGNASKRVIASPTPRLQRMDGR